MADQEEDQGITAYHGSPHEFEQFDLSKIGTGEGAQAYGHGLYFAENEPVAQEYRDALSGHHLYYEQDPFDQKYYVINLKNEEVQHHSDTEEEAKNFINQHKKQGHMYQVAINAHPDHFLDWDKPLSEQSEHVQNLIKEHFPSALDDVRQQTGQNFYKEQVRNMMKTGTGNIRPEQFISNVLNHYGIKGIKYFDAGSRGNAEKPTRNYVVFDDKLVNVKRRYAQGGEVEREGLDVGGLDAFGDPSKGPDEYGVTTPMEVRGNLLLGVSPEQREYLSSEMTKQMRANEAPQSSVQPKQTIRQNFEQAFASARARGDETFSWTNPATGKAMLYTTQLARKEGGRVPSMKTPDDWLASVNKPRQTSKPSSVRKPSKVEGTTIVRRALMLSSRKS